MLRRERGAWPLTLRIVGQPSADKYAMVNAQGRERRSRKSRAGKEGKGGGGEIAIVGRGRRGRGTSA